MNFSAMEAIITFYHGSTEGHKHGNAAKAYCVNLARTFSEHYGEDPNSTLADVMDWFDAFSDPSRDFWLPGRAK